MSKFYLHMTNGKRAYLDGTGIEAADADAALAFGRVLELRVTLNKTRSTWTCGMKTTAQSAKFR